MLDCFSAFSASGVHPAIARGLEASEHFRATFVQEQVIRGIGTPMPLILKSPSGTGKTCAYCISMLEVICRRYFAVGTDRAPKLPKGGMLGLVLTHSPELCQQIAKEMQSISRYLPLSVYAIVSSINLKDDWEDVAEANIVVATPGIVVKLLNKKKLRTFCLMSLVIDEWDKMIGDKGLSKDVEQILKKPMNVIQQHICASATYSQEAYKKLYELLPLQWKMISCEWNSKAILTKNYLCRAGSFDKRVNTILEIFRKVKFHQALIFCNLHQLNETLESILNESGYPCAFLSSQMEQKERLDKVSEFRDLVLRCLITTDIAARGIDIPNVNIVISLDLPYDNQTFTHRIGRTGRFMTNGISITFYKRQDSKRIQKICEECRVEFEKLDLNNFQQIRLPILQNEKQIQNYIILRNVEQEVIQKEKEISEKEGSNKVPMMFYCDKESEYWSNYRDICNEFRPPFLPQN